MKQLDMLNNPKYWDDYIFRLLDCQVFVGQDYMEQLFQEQRMDIIKYFQKIELINLEE